MGRGLHFPFQIGALGLPRTAGRRAELVQQLHQLLFTLPGERVGRPDFGVGVQRLVFSGASPEAAAAAEYLVQVGVDRYLADRIALDAVAITTRDAELVVDLLFTFVETGEEESVTFTRPLEGPP